MVICRNYMFESKCQEGYDKEKDIIREVAVGKVVAHLCPTLIVKELNISVELSRVGR
jgi:hypothetical protein